MPVVAVVLAMLAGFGWPATRAAAQTPTPPAPTPPFRVKTIGQGPGATPLVSVPTGLAPATIGAVYHLRTGLASPTSAIGAGQVIAIVDAYDDPDALSDLNVFNAQYGYPALGTCSATPPFTATTGACFYQADPQGTFGADSGWILEESLDIEWAHAEAPGATIVLVEAATSSYTDLMSAVSWANDNGATEVSMSWDSRESSGETGYDSDFAAKSTSTGAPIIYTASSGDCGSGAACGFGAEYPATSPNVIAVGGTTLNGCSGTSCADFSSETAWSGSGGGISAYEKIPAYQSGYRGRRPSSDPTALKKRAATTPRHHSPTTPTGTPSWASQSLRNMAATNSTATARLAAAVACSGAADGRRCPATTPPTRKAAATRQVAMIQR
jgi:hypothetical protein